MKLIKIIGFICVVCGIGFLILNLPFFTINEVVINGNNRVTNDEILETIEYEPDAINYFFFNKKEAKEKLFLNPYIEEISFSYAYPKQLIIELVEREQIAYVPYGTNNYLYISREGIVLETSNQILEPLPIIKGVSFREFSLGEVLISNGEVVLKDVVEIINTMKKYEMDTKNLVIDISNNSEIKIKDGKISINFGQATEIDKKIRTLYGILEALEEREDLEGEIDLSNTNIEPVLKM